MSVKVHPPTTKITSLCSNCLLSVFHYLSVTDLANLSQANLSGKLGKRSKDDRFKQCIVKAFRGKVRIDTTKTFVHVEERYAVNDMKMLRNFGKEMEHLSIDYFSVSRRYEHSLENTISRYCWDTLSNIELVRLKTDSMNELDRPFTNAESVAFCDGHLGSTLGQLNKWFPNMDDLEFKDTYVFDAKCIHEHFPQLTSITVWNDCWQQVAIGKNIFTNSDLKVFFLLNPQLETLSIRHDDVDEGESGAKAIIIDWEFIAFINEKLKLSELTLNLENYRFNRKWQSVITFASLSELCVTCGNGDCLDKIQIAAPNLNRLKVDVDFAHDKELNYGAFATFVIRCEPKVLKINMEYVQFVVDNAHILKIIRTLTSLQELVVVCVWKGFLPAAILNLLVNSATLNKLVGVFNFSFDSDANPQPDYKKMPEIFRAEIFQNDAVQRQWTYQFDYEIDSIFEIASIVFRRKEEQ